MNYNIKNEYLDVTISSFGAELQSIKNKNNIEYLWQGDEKYWKGRSPVLFPYVGRLTNGQYKLDSKIYNMRIHGIAEYYEHIVVDKKDDSITFELKSNDEIFSQYPRDFVFNVTYTLKNNIIIVRYDVYNVGNNIMYFGVGGHPAFNVPIDINKKFEDYYIKFLNQKNIQKVCFSDTCFPTGKYENFILDSDNKILLKHNLFDNDAIVLTNMGDEVSLGCEESLYKINVKFKNMPYLGLWHKPKSDAPYVCIEPWCTLPSREGILEELETQPGLIKLEPNKNFNVEWSIELN